MAELPILPIATAALISDTTHMTAEQFGAYVRILLAMWNNGAEIADDDHSLARIAGVTVKRWQAIRKVVLAPIRIVDGVLHQKRLSATWDDVQKLRVKRKGAAKERWHRERLRDAHAYAKPMQKACKPDAHAMQLKLKEDTTTTFVGTARASETGEKPPENEGNEPKSLALPAVATPAGFAMEARKAVQQASSSIGSGELVEVMASKGWVRP